MSLTISGANRPWSTTPGVPANRAASARAVLDRAEIVGDQVVLWTGRDIAQDRLAQHGERRARAKAQDLQRHRRAQLCRPAFSAEAITTNRACGCRDDLLVRVSAAAALDEPSAWIDLIGAVDRDVQVTELVELVHRRAPARGLRVRWRARWPRSAGSDRVRPARAAGARRLSLCPGRHDRRLFRAGRQPLPLCASARPYLSWAPVPTREVTPSCSEPTGPVQWRACQGGSCSLRSLVLLGPSPAVSGCVSGLLGLSAQEAPYRQAAS